MSSEKALSARLRSSSSDGDLIDTEDFRNEDDDLYDGDVCDRRRRTSFTLPRSNSKRRGRKETRASSHNDEEPLYCRSHEKLSSKNKKLFRRPTWKSFSHLMNKMLRHMTPAAAPPVSSSASPTVAITSLQRHRRVSLSASSTDVRPVCTRTEEPGIAPAPRSKPLQAGIAGLRNHGNTCFMNAILQCICHTDALAEYFVMDQYKVDLSRRNKSNSKKYGTRGEVTEQLALLLKALWSCNYTPDISNQFKTVVGKYDSQYMGSNQHDAQEFLLWLLDKVHEDLNTATKKKYKKNKNNHGRPEEVVAAEALANHMRCNSSFVHYLFQALYRSSLTCPKCQSRSITFDPFLCVSIPIPEHQVRPVFVTVVYLNQQPKQVKLGLSINSQATIRELRETLSSDTGIPSDRFLLIDLVPEGFHHVFKDTQPLGSIQDTDNIYAIEVPQLHPIDPREGEHLLLVWLNRLGVASQGKRFGSPYALEVPREISFEELQRRILTTMNSVQEDALKEEMGELFRLRVVDGIPFKCYLPTDVDHPLYMPSVDNALSNLEKDHGPTHLKLIVEWTQENKDRYLANIVDVVEEHSSVKLLQNQQEKATTATLSDCFELYTQEEKLGPEDPWMCPRCKQLRQGVKKLGLWTVPDLLIIHLKRFRQTPTQGTKLSTLVDFPVMGLDMSPHIVGRANNHHFPSNGFSTFSYWSPWRRHRRGLIKNEDNLFDLYAVCNHHGNMQGGHYTAYCKNPTDGRWYLFDDTTVQPMEEGAEIVTPNAYILFYQRSTLSGSGSSSSSSSSSSNGSDHWAYRMPVFNYTPPKFSKSQDNLASIDGHDDSNSKNKANKTFVRGIRPYNSMVPLGSHKHHQEVVVPDVDYHSDEEENHRKMYITESCV